MDKPAVGYQPKLRIGLILTVEAECDLLPRLLRKHEVMDDFFAFPHLGKEGMTFNCCGLGGGSQDFDNPTPRIRLWTTTYVPMIEYYQNKVAPVLYSFLSYMDREDVYSRTYRYLFIEIGLTRNSVVVRGDYHDNPSNFRLKTTIWPFETTPI